MITVNGRGLADVGFTARTRRYPALGGQDTSTLGLPGTAGEVVTGSAGGTGRLLVSGHITGLDHDDLHERLSELTTLVQGECVIQLHDYPDREWHGVLSRPSNPVTELDPQWRSLAARVSLDWTLPDPLAVARTPTVGGPDTPLELGSGPSPVAVDVQANAGTVSEITIEVHTNQGVRSLVWEGELEAPDTWHVDDESYNVTVGGVNAVDGLAPDSVFPYADPAEGAHRVTVDVEGDATVTVRYRKRWW